VPTLDDLAESYAKYRVTVVTLIFTKPSSFPTPSGSGGSAEVATAVYVLSALVSFACVALLLRSWADARSGLLFWAALCFLGPGGGGGNGSKRQSHIEPIGSRPARVKAVIG
jgi:hypothetical protein